MELFWLPASLSSFLRKEWGSASEAESRFLIVGCVGVAPAHSYEGDSVVHETKKVWLPVCKNYLDLLHCGGWRALETSTSQVTNLQFSPPLTWMLRLEFCSSSRLSRCNQTCHLACIQCFTATSFIMEAYSLFGSVCVLRCCNYVKLALSLSLFLDAGNVHKP